MVTPSTRARRRWPQAGFTLVELVVVLTLIGLLVSIAAPRYFHVIGRGRESVQRQNMTVVRDAIDKFYGDLGHYPDSLEDLVTRHYLREVPTDPVSGSRGWTIVAPADASQGAVYDIQPPAPPASGAEGTS